MPENKVYLNKWPDHPDYDIELETSPKQIKVVFGGEVIANSRNVTILNEKNHGPVYYFPREDVRMDLLQSTDQHSHCPFKGHCSYFSISVGSVSAENAVWSYEDPYPEINGLKNLLAFYPDRVDEIKIV